MGSQDMDEDERDLWSKCEEREGCSSQGMEDDESHGMDEDEWWDLWLKREESRLENLMDTARTDVGWLLNESQQESGALVEVEQRLNAIDVQLRVCVAWPNGQ